MSKEIRPTALPGLAGIGLITTGIAGIIHAFLSGGSLSLGSVRKPYSEASFR